MFERLLLAMPAAEQTDVLPLLLDLRIPRAGEEPGRPVGQWRDPTSFVSYLADRLVPVQMALSEHAKRLVSIVRDGTYSRSVAVTRLEVLNRGGALTEELKRDYASALWSCAGEDGGVPDVEGFSLHLGLVTSEGYMDARDRFKTWALGTSIPDLYVTVQFPGGVVGRESHDHWVNRHIAALDGATRYPWIREPYASVLVDWSPTEAMILLQLIENWSSSLEGVTLAAGTGFADREVDAANNVGHFLATALLPRIDASTAATRTRLERISIALGAKGATPLEQYPIWLLADEKSDVAEHARRSLASRDDKVVRDALWRLLEWFNFGISGVINGPPDDLLDQIFLLTCLAPGRSVSTAFTVAYEVYRRDPVIFNVVRRRWLRVSLGRLFGTDTLPGPHGRPMPLTGVGDARTAAARLLTAMAIDEAEAAIWTELLHFAEADPYPEVRRACEEVRDRLGADRSKAD